MFLFVQFAATRAALAVLTLIMVSFIVFSLMELVPGDCAERYLAFKIIRTAAPTMAARCFLKRVQINCPWEAVK